MALDLSFKPNIDESNNALEDKTFQCNYDGCEKIFPTADQLKDHLNMHSKPRTFECTYKGCSKSYTNAAHLKRHAETHSALKIEYICKYCSARISTLSNLKRHYNRAHNAQRDLYCMECRLYFNKRNRFEEHKAWHANSKSAYKCEKCGKSFGSHFKLMNHSQLHVVKNYKCLIESCPLTFEKWALMLKHRRTDHIIEHSCKDCEKTFSSRCKLRNHQKTHTDKRPVIPCPYENCKRLYYFKRNLNSHIKSQHLGKLFHCDMCNKRLVSKQKIKEHIINIHLKKTKSTNIKKKQAIRKDIGIAKKTVISSLIGTQLSCAVEARLMRRNPTALLRDELVDSFSEEADASSDFSVKGA